MIEVICGYVISKAFSNSRKKKLLSLLPMIIIDLTMTARLTSTLSGLVPALPALVALDDEEDWDQPDGAADRDDAETAERIAGARARVDHRICTACTHTLSATSVSVSVYFNQLICPTWKCCVTEQTLHAKYRGMDYVHRADVADIVRAFCPLTNGVLAAL